MNCGMKKRLGDRLPYSIKSRLERLIARFVDFFLHITICNGQELKHLKDFLEEKKGVNQKKDDVQQIASHSSHITSWYASDFLFIMDAVSGRKRPEDAANRHIVCSIVIPVFNKADYTFQCIRSLMREIDFKENEVIVVNNASKDETEQILSYMDGLVRVIHNRENQGFVRACNQGAAVARGKYIIFLNNDTVVLPGWLKHLVDTAENDTSIGAVGSMMIYPDGRLQEAGGIIWKDGTGEHYGRGRDPRNKKYNFAREVDYCSGASLLVRKELFDKLGGFDERYIPAFYEDADLCFGIRSLGYKVIYQPASKLFHHEGITAGTNVNADFKQYQEINRRKFVKKWKEPLEREQSEKGSATSEVAANRWRGPQFIIFDQIIPAPDQDSGSVRMTMILKALSKLGRLAFVPMNPSVSPGYKGFLEQDGIEIIYPMEYLERIKSDNFQLAILSRADVANKVLPEIREVNKDIRVIFDTVDVHFLRFEREYNLTGDEKIKNKAAHYKEIETQLARLSDAVWCITSKDKKVLSEAVPEVKIQVIPNIHLLQERGKKFDEREGLLFIGGFAHPPNKDAIHYFMKQIYPIIQETIPEVKFYVVGSRMPEEILAYSDEKVVVLGFVKDVDHLFHGCRVMIAPLRYGAGMKGKVGQALSYGLPVVTTSIGSEGMGLMHGHNVMIADDPVSFAEAVLKVYRDRDLWQQLSDEGYRHIQRHFVPEVVEEKILAAVMDVCGDRDRSKYSK